MRYYSLFSYFGGKSKLAHLYPKPRHDLIIEPFAGGASYSLRYYNRQVLLNDLDDKTAAIWRYLLKPDVLEDFSRNVKLPLVAGSKISEVLPANCDLGLLYFLQAEANRGTQGLKGVHDVVTRYGVEGSKRLLKKLEFFLPRISHWQFTQGSYKEIPNQTATWFIDPPYSNLAGSRYRCSLNPANFAYLHSWVKERRGQTITCENEGATWDDFKTLRRCLGIKNKNRKSFAVEVFCERNEEEINGLDLCKV